MTPARKSKRAGIYVRISDDRTGKEAEVKRQEADCRALAEERGLEVVEVYSDNSVSASKRDVVCPAYDRMWRDVRDGRIDTVVVYHPDRLYRRVRFLEDVVETVEDIAKSGRAVSILTVNGDIDLSTGTGRMSARMFAALAQYEAEGIGERVTRAVKTVKEEGRFSGGRRPFGYRYDPVIKVLSVDPEEADAIRAGAELLLNGSGIRNVAREWTRRGLTTTAGGAWTARSVRQVYTAERIIGKRDGKPAQWQPILTGSVFDRLQRIFRANEATSIRRGERYLLTGLLRCGICDGKMVGRPQHGRARYICIATGSVHLGVIADGLEACIVEAASPMRLTNAVELADLSTIAPELRAELATVEARVAEIADGLAEGKLSVATASKVEDKLTARLAELESAIAKAEEEARPKNPWLALQEELEGDWRAWLDTLIESVTIARADTGRTFDCSRVSITWKQGVTQK